MLGGDRDRSLFAGMGKNPPTHVQNRAASCPDPPALCNMVRLGNLLTLHAFIVSHRLSASAVVPGKNSNITGKSVELFVAGPNQLLFSLNSDNTFHTVCETALLGETTTAAYAGGCLRYIRQCPA